MVPGERGDFGTDAFVSGGSCAAAAFLDSGNGFCAVGSSSVSARNFGSCAIASFPTGTSGSSTGVLDTSRVVNLSGLRNDESSKQLPNANERI